VLKFCVSKAERTFQVVNLFHSYDLPVGSYVDTDCVLLSIFTYTLLNLINLSVKSDTFPIKLNLMLSIDELSINFNEFRKLAI